jgi:hypothetical protein
MWIVPWWPLEKPLEKLYQSLPEPASELYYGAWLRYWNAMWSS